MAYVTRPPSLERFYEESVARLANVFIEQQNEARLFNAVMANPAWIQIATQVLQQEMQALTPPQPLSAEQAQEIIGGIVATRHAAQKELLRLTGDEAFRGEVALRASAIGAEALPSQAISRDPACTILLADEPEKMKANYKALQELHGNEATHQAIIAERGRQHALSMTFDSGGKQPLLEPLTAALTQACEQLKTEDPGFAFTRTPHDLASDFLAARTKEALDQEKLLAPNGWMLNQLGLAAQAATTVSGDGKTVAGTVQAAPAIHHDLPDGR